MAQGKAMSCISKGLSRDDKDSLGEYDTAKEAWTYFKTKYAKTSALTANTYITRLQTFIYNKTKGIDHTQTKLKEYQQKLVVAKSLIKQAYLEEALLLILTNALPQDFKTIINGFAVNKLLSVDDKLKILREKEERMKRKIR